MEPKPLFGWTDVRRRVKKGKEVRQKETGNE